MVLLSLNVQQKYKCLPKYINRQRILIAWFYCFAENGVLSTVNEAMLIV